MEATIVAEWRQVPCLEANPKASAAAAVAVGARNQAAALLLLQEEEQQGHRTKEAMLFAADLDDIAEPVAVAVVAVVVVGMAIYRPHPWGCTSRSACMA